MSSRARSSRSSRPRSRRPAAIGPVFTAILLAVALLAQAGLSALHGLSHAASRGSHATEVGDERLHAHVALTAEDVAAAGKSDHLAHHDHGSELASGGGGHGHHHDPVRGPGHRHEPTSDSCDLCALIAIGRLGWAAPAPTVIVGATLVVDVRADLPSSRTLRPSLISAAPRGPPSV